MDSRRTDEERREDAQVFGLPTLNLDSMSGTSVPEDFEFEAVLGDIIMAEIIDTNAQGEVYRAGIWISQDITKRIWRRAKVTMMGPKVPKEVTIGCHIAYPSDKGIPMVSANKKKYIYLNAERIFGILKPIDIPQS